jgi:DNA topoisomerase-1
MQLGSGRPGAPCPTDRSFVTHLSSIAARVAAKYQKKKEVPKADGKGTTTVYEYGPGQVSHRNREKAKRVEKLRGSMGKLRTKYRKDLGSSDPKTRLTALAVALIDLTYERVGNEGSAKDNGHFGVTTWQADHVKVKGDTAIIRYTGKSGVKHKKTVTDAKVVSTLKAALKGKGKGDQVLCEGEECTIKASDVNAYLEDFGVTAKDIRGLHANEEMRKALAEIRKAGPDLPTARKEKDAILKDEFAKALEQAAEAVGHEPSTLKSQYLVPGLEKSYLHDGSVMKRLDKTSALRVAIIHINNATDGEGDLQGLQGLTSSLTLYERAVIQDLLINGDPIQKHGSGFTLRGTQMKHPSAVTELVGAGYLEEKGSEVSLSPMFLAKLDLYAPNARKAALTVRLGPRTFKVLRAGDRIWEVQDQRTGLGYTLYFTSATKSLTPRQFASRVVLDSSETRGEESQVFPIRDFSFSKTGPEEQVAARWATKSDAEVEDEEAERLVRPSPKKKPPRKDLERHRVEEKGDRDGDKDPDEEQDRKDRSRNYKDASHSRVALRYYLAKITQTNDGRYKAERPDSEVPQYFDTEDKAKAWVEGEKSKPEDEPKGEKSKGEPEGDGDGKPSAPEADSPEKLKALRSDLMKEYADRGLTKREIKQVLDEVEKAEDLESAKELLDEAADEKAKAKVEQARKKQVSQSVKPLSGAAKKQVSQALDSFDDEQMAAFSQALEAESSKLGQEGVEDTAAFRESVSKIKATLANPNPNTKLRKDPAEMAKAVAAVAYHDGVVDNPLANTDPKIGNIPDKGGAITDSAKRKEVEKAALARAEDAVYRYREMSPEDRKRHAARITKEIDELREVDDEGNETEESKANKSERRIHLEALQKGIGMASAIEDGDNTQGVGGSIARLARAAAKTGNVEKLLKLNSLDSKDNLGSDDQAVLRSVYEDLTDGDWEDIIPKGHPGESIVELLNDPEEGQFLTSADRQSLRKALQDMMVAEASFLDPTLADPDALEVGKEGKARAARTSAVSEMRRKKPPLKKVKETIDWFSEWIKKLTQRSGRKKGSRMQWDFAPWPKVSGAVLA